MARVIVESWGLSYWRASVREAPGLYALAASVDEAVAALLRDHPRVDRMVRSASGAINISLRLQPHKE